MEVWVIVWSGFSEPRVCSSIKSTANLLYDMLTDWTGYDEDFTREEYMDVIEESYGDWETFTARTCNKDLARIYRTTIEG